jgi:hypothetical protein
LSIGNIYSRDGAAFCAFGTSFFIEIFAVICDVEFKYLDHNLKIPELKSVSRDYQGISR